MRIRFKIGFVLFIIIFFIDIKPLQSQIKKIFKDKQLEHQIGFDVAPGKLFMSDNFFNGENEKGKEINKCLSLHLKYGFQFGKDSYLGMMYPNTYQGIGFSFNSFSNYSEIGNPIAIYLYQRSQIVKIHDKLSFDYEWNFGASFGWNPYDENNNYNNIVVGSKVNAYINLGFYLNWKINKNFALSPGIGFTHYSNGNTYLPNGGVNNINIRLNAIYKFNSVSNYQKVYNNDYLKKSFKHSFSYDLIAYGAIKSKVLLDENYVIPGEFGVLGININPMYSVNKYFKAGLSLDCQYDESANIDDFIAGRDENYDIKFYRPPFEQQLGIGISARAEFVMPIFSINVGIGHNIIYKGDDLSGFYQIIVLKTFITDKIFLHTGYQLHKFKLPNNLMIGIGYRF